MDASINRRRCEKLRISDFVSRDREQIAWTGVVSEDNTLRDLLNTSNSTLPKDCESLSLIWRCEISTNLHKEPPREVTSTLEINPSKNSYIVREFRDLDSRYEIENI